MMKYFAIVLLFAVVGCVGTDTLDFEILPVRVEITTFADSLKVGDTFQFAAQYIDSIGEPTNRQVYWSSGDTDLLIIEENGLARGLAPGTVTVRAYVGEVEDEVSVVVGERTVGGASVRTGTFTGVSGYNMSGEFRIFEDEGVVFLEFLDSSIDAGAPGPYYYLSNQPTGVSGGLSLGEAPNGYAIYELPEDVTVNTYDYVIIWCEPFSVLLGGGEFEN